jgi:hypothetical protein
MLCIVVNAQNICICPSTAMPAFVSTSPLQYKFVVYPPSQLKMDLTAEVEQLQLRAVEKAAAKQQQQQQQQQVPLVAAAAKPVHKRQQQTAPVAAPTSIAAAAADANSAALPNFQAMSAQKPYTGGNLISWLRGSKKNNSSSSSDRGHAVHQWH